MYDAPLEATYIFPLPDRSAVVGMRMTVADRVIEAHLQERGAARQAYDTAIAAGQRASIAEEERPDVFTLRVGNILPGERVTVLLTLAGALPVEDGEATFRFPLVVAPRYIPGAALAGGAVGAGYALDTDAVPDASRITPPVLLPGFPNPVLLTIDVGIDPAGLAVGEARSSLHAVTSTDGRIRIQPGERPNRDFVLRMPFDPAGPDASLIVVPDAEGDEGTYQLTVPPPAESGSSRPRDVVLLLDRSGSMQGWAMVAARRAAARIIDTLTDRDRFAVLAFDDLVDRPVELAAGLVAASDRHRYRAVEFLARLEARGGTELLAPLRQALAAPVAAGRGATGCSSSSQTVRSATRTSSCASRATRLRDVRVHTPSGSTAPSTPGSSAGWPAPGVGAANSSRARTGSTTPWRASTGGSARHCVTRLRARRLPASTLRPGYPPPRCGCRTCSPASHTSSVVGIPVCRGSAAGQLPAATGRDAWSVTSVSQHAARAGGHCSLSPRQNCTSRTVYDDVHRRIRRIRKRPPGRRSGGADRRHVPAVRRAVPVHRLRRRRHPGGDRREAPVAVVQPVESPDGWDMFAGHGAPAPMAMPVPAPMPVAHRPCRAAACRLRGGRPVLPPAPGGVFGGPPQMSAMPKPDAARQGPAGVARRLLGKRSSQSAPAAPAMAAAMTPTRESARSTDDLPTGPRTRPDV